ncbi:Polyadenylate-binding protein-interacting protein [Asimina triloba]
MAAVAENAIRSDDQFRRRTSPPPPAAAGSDDQKSEFQHEVRKLVDFLSKLNPSAKEFFPSSYSADKGQNDQPAAAIKDSSSDGSSGGNRRKKSNYNQWKRRPNGRSLRAQKEREDSIRKTVYVSDIDQHVTEERLAALFDNCGQVVDCRICGDPHSVLRFAFVEFSDEQSARAALNLSGTMLGFYPVRVLPSKTAILPVNPTFLPRVEYSQMMKGKCAQGQFIVRISIRRYAIAKTIVSQADVKIFFESTCGEVSPSE